MTYIPKILLATLMLAFANTAWAQSDDEELKLAALEALMSAPPERALPIATRVLRGDGSDELKEGALFVISQIDRPEAHAILLETAQSGSGELRHEAIRMVGIGGDPDALAGLGEIYASGDEDVRESVLEAYLIADDAEAIYQIAANAQDPEEFDEAVDMLGAMGALDELRALSDRADMSEQLIDAYAIAGDTETLQMLAADNSDPERQAQAIRALGIAEGPDTEATLLNIYRNSPSADVREAALEGMLIADYDEAVLTLFRESQDTEEKRELLETLVIMDSDAVWEIVDQTLGQER